MRLSGQRDYMVDKPGPTDRSYCFGPFRLDVSHQLLYKDGQPVELARRLVRTLQLLVENRGRDLTKAYLMEQLWPDMVVEESNLTVIISMLRKVLGDDVGPKKYILTNPRSGYRFVGDVTGTQHSAPLVRPVVQVAPDPVIAESPVASSLLRQSFFRRHRSLVFAGAAAGLLIVVTGYGIREWNQHKAPQSIAVLPFRSLGTDNDDGYLGLGMADGLIARLRNVRHVVVRPTAVVAKYQNTAYDPLALGKELDVVSLLDGTVQRTGDQVWLRVKLLRVRDGATLWAQEYHGWFADIFTLQDQIADQAIRTLALKLDSAEQQSIRHHYTGSSEAYQLYLAARYHCRAGANAAGRQKGIPDFQQAIEVDPQFALAYANLAACYEALDRIVSNGASESTAKAEAAAQRALQIDSGLRSAYLPLAVAKTYYDWDFPHAELAFRKSIDLDPEDAEAHSEYAKFLVSQGRFAEAEREARQSADLALAPFLWDANAVVSNVYFFARRYQEAADWWEKSQLVSLDVSLDEAAWHLGWIYSSQGREIPMIDDLVKAESTASLKGTFTVELAYLHALKGTRPLAESYLQKLGQYSEKVDDYHIALVYAALGDKDKAFQALDRARAGHSWNLIFLNVDPRLESLHSDPRFTDLVRSIHLRP